MSFGSKLRELKFPNEEMLQRLCPYSKIYEEAKKMIMSRQIDFICDLTEMTQPEEDSNNENEHNI